MRKQYLKPLIAMVTAVLAICAAFVIFFGNDGEYAVEVNLYFLNKGTTAVAEEKRDITYDTNDEIIPKIVKEISQGSRERDRERIVPGGVKVNSVSYMGNGSAVVDVSSKLLTEDASHNLLAAYTIIKSLCAVSAVTGAERVKITVDGEEIFSSDGKKIDFLSYDDISFSDETAEDKKARVLLYFEEKNKHNLRAELRSISGEDGKKIEECVVEALLKGPKSASLKKTVAGEMISAETKDGICFVNFKFSFVEKNMGKYEENAVRAVVNSLSSLPWVNGVRILVEGKKIEKLGEVDVGGTLTADE